MKALLKYKIYVLSLNDEFERRKDINNQLSSQKQNFEFIDAIDLRHVSETELDSYRNLKALNSKRQLKKSELGCMLSHQLIYEKVIKEDIDFAVILEDDAFINSEFADFINSICTEQEQIKYFNILLSGYTKLLKKDEKRFYLKEPIKKVFKIANKDIGNVWTNWTSGTVSYIITKQGAKKMVSLSNYGLADDWGIYSSKGINVMHLRPLICYEQFYKHESSIEAERKAFRIDKWTPKEFLRVCRGLLSYVAFRVL